MGRGGEREGLAPHHSEDLGLVGEGAPVRPRVAGGGGGDEREGQELPGHHEDSFMEESSDDDMDIINERGEVINYEEADSDDSEDEFKDLDNVGSAIERMLAENNLEKFLITDSKPENCKWKVYHDCIKQLQHGGGYEGLKYHDDVEPVEDTFLGRTRKQKETVNQRKDENIYEKANEKV